MTLPPFSDEQLREWADHRADDAGRLAREVIELRAALRNLIDRLDEIADAIKPHRVRKHSGGGS